MTIVAVTAAKKHVYHIEMDDGVCGDIDKTVWEHSGLTKGVALSDEEWETLCARSESHRAYERALYYLSLRDYGRGEMVRKLTAASFSRDVAEEAALRLCRNGLIDDVRYASALARDMSARKLYSKRRIVMALKEKGFDNETVEEVILQIPEEDVQQALELLRKKRYNKLTVSSSRDKLLAMLARYGFSYGTSRRALSLWEEELQDDFEGE